MEISPIIFWNIILTLVIGPALWAFRSLLGKVETLQSLIAITREDYATKAELKDNNRNIMDALHRLEDKLDKLDESLKRG